MFLLSDIVTVSPPSVPPDCLWLVCFVLMTGLIVDGCLGGVVAVVVVVRIFFLVVVIGAAASLVVAAACLVVAAACLVVAAATVGVVRVMTGGRLLARRKSKLVCLRMIFHFEIIEIFPISST